MILNHYELVQRAIKWLRNTRGCWFVASECHTVLNEIPDAIGWLSSSSILIECKASRNDFLQDKKKHSRKFPKQGLGNWRYYMTEPGMIEPGELPEGWGLLEAHPKVVRYKVLAKRFNDIEIAHRERPILVSLVRRLNRVVDEYSLNQIRKVIQ